MERVRGIEPPYSAWEADVLPLNYTREQSEVYRTTPHRRPARSSTTGGRSIEEAHSTPDSDERADTEEPVGATRSELTRFTLGRPVPLVLDDRVAVADDHRGAEGEGHLFDQQAEVEDLFHRDEGTCSALFASTRRDAAVTTTRTEAMAVSHGVDTLPRHEHSKQ